MSTLSRNKLLFLLAGLLIISLAKNVSAGALAEINPFVGGPYTAGVSNTDVFIDYDDTANVTPCVDSPGSAATSGTVVSLVLVDQSDNSEITTAHNQQSFTTNGSATTFGLSGNPFTFYRTGTFKLRARSTSPALESTSCTSFVVNPAGPSKLIVTVAGESLTGGMNTGNGKTGSANSVVSGSTFAVTVTLTDPYHNIVTSSGPILIDLTGDSNASIPISQKPLSNGQATFIVSLTSPKITETFTASASTSSYTPGTTVVTSAGPENEKVNVFPSPFNPYVADANTGGYVHFQYVVDAPKTVTIKVIDQFGGQVWEKADSGQPNTLNIVRWDGRNGEGNIVAAGAYYVLLEVGGDLKSKKKFGVVK